MKGRGKKTAREYDAQARKLKAFGFGYSYRIGRKNTPQARAVITRAFKARRSFLSLKPSTQPVKFTKFKTPSERRLAKEVLSPEAITPTGFFTQVPKGVKAKDYTQKIAKGRIVEFTRGRQLDEIVRPSAKGLAKDPVAEIRSTLKRVKRETGKKRIRGVRFLVGGNEGKQLFGQGQFALYWGSLQRRLIGDGKGQMSRREFNDKFQMRVIFKAA